MRSSSYSSDCDSTSADMKYEEENMEHYRIGGYHHVAPGEVYYHRYKIVKKLGFGYFSTVWMAEDLKGRKDKKHRFVAIKFTKSAKRYKESFQTELSHLKKIRKMDREREQNVVSLLDFFEHNGPNGIHLCFVFEMLGKNLLTLIIDYEKDRDKKLAADKNDPSHTLPLVPLARLKSVCRDALRGLHFLHSRCRLVHTDVKPENLSLASEETGDAAANGAGDTAAAAAINGGAAAAVAVNNGCAAAEEDDGSGGGWGRVKILDLGNSVSLSEVDDSEIATVQYRAPEVILGQVFNEKVDIWAFACVIFEMATGDYLFDPREPKDYSYTRDIDHLALMVELLGDMPKRFTKKGANAGENFGKNGKLKQVKKLDYWCLADVLREKYSFPRPAAEEMAAFLGKLLRYDPKERLSASEALRDPWLS